MKPRVLIVDDHLELAETLADGLADRGFHALPCADGREAVRRVEGEPIDALVTDLRMPEIDGMGLLARSRGAAPERPVIVMTAYGAVETAVEAIRQGAYHYLTKPFRVDELAVFLGRALDDARVRREARSLRAALRDEYRLDRLVAASPAMRDVFDVAARVADASTPVLLYGETGTGKTALARAIHATSARAAGPFVAVNCAALPEALLESELFGHVKGAFTGATSARAGLFADADGGTLLLDEIGEMSPALQAKLLHVLETGDVRAVGASKPRHVDVRVLAATHRDLRERVRSGAFREDLLYRLDVVPIEIPPLRRRREDIPLLVERLLVEQRAKHPRAVVERFSADAMAKLLGHAWPGNVRELGHAVERAVLFGRAAEASAAELPPAVTSPQESGAAAGAGPGDLFAGGGAVLPIREVQRRYAAWALERFEGHKTRTAEALGIDGKTLAKWLGDEGDASTNGNKR
ncbi:MAG TPA: sigma-54 dependent transcriptional regulator [Polyangiaceae bacterium]|nr:sigma-54 dependent transcriptional regulator [Polyangiaceae bacterium]